MMIMRHEYNVNNDQYIAVIGNDKTIKGMGWIQSTRFSICCKFTSPGAGCNDQEPRYFRRNNEVRRGNGFMYKNVFYFSMESNMYDLFLNLAIWAFILS